MKRANRCKLFYPNTEMASQSAVQELEFAHPSFDSTLYVIRNTAVSQLLIGWYMLMADCQLLLCS